MDDLENELWSPVQFDEFNDSSESNVTKKEKKSKLPLADPFPLGEYYMHKSSLYTSTLSQYAQHSTRAVLKSNITLPSY